VIEMTKNEIQNAEARSQFSVLRKPTP